MSNPGQPPPQPGDANPYGQPPPQGYPYQPAMQQPPMGPPGLLPPTSPPPRRPGMNRGATIAIAALSVLAIILGIMLGVQAGKRTDTAAPLAATTVTETVNGTASTVTVSGTDVTGGPGVTTTETVTETSTVQATGGDPANTDVPTSVDEPSGPIVGKVGAPLPLVWNDFGKTAKGSLTINSAKRVASFGTERKDTPKNGVFLTVDVTYTVVSGVVDYNSYDWKMKDTEGREYRSTLVFYAPFTRLGSGSVGAGDKVRGFITFDVPKGPIKLTYTIGGDLGATWQIPA